MRHHPLVVFGNSPLHRHAIHVVVMDLIRLHWPRKKEPKWNCRYKRGRTRVVDASIVLPLSPHMLFYTSPCALVSAFPLGSRHAALSLRQ